MQKMFADDVTQVFKETKFRKNFQEGFQQKNASWGRKTKSNTGQWKNKTNKFKFKVILKSMKFIPMTNNHYYK